MATLRNYILPIERDALTKRAAMRKGELAASAKSSGQDQMNWWGSIGPAAPQKPPPAPKRFEVVGGWPGVKGKVYLDEPVADRFGEVIVVYRDPQSAHLKSRVVGHVPRQGDKTIEI